MGNKDFPDLTILSGAMIAEHADRDKLFLNADEVKEKYISKQKVQSWLMETFDNDLLSRFEKELGLDK